MICGGGGSWDSKPDADVMNRCEDLVLVVLRLVLVGLECCDGSEISDKVSTSMVEARETDRTVCWLFCS